MSARRCLPTQTATLTGCDPSAAAAAGAGSTFVGERHAVAKAGVEQEFPSVHRAKPSVPGFRLHLHVPSGGSYRSEQFRGRNDGNGARIELIIGQN